MFDDAIKESCTIWFVKLASMRRATEGIGKIQQGQVAAGRTRIERRSDYEPVDNVPFPNSSRMIKERSVQFLRANETWLRSIMKADCS